MHGIVFLKTRWRLDWSPEHFNSRQWHVGAFQSRLWSPEEVFETPSVVMDFTGVPTFPQLFLAWPFRSWKRFKPPITQFSSIINNDRGYKKPRFRLYGCAFWSTYLHVWEAIERSLSGGPGRGAGWTSVIACFTDSYLLPTFHIAQLADQSPHKLPKLKVIVCQRCSSTAQQHQPTDCQINKE